MSEKPLIKQYLQLRGEFMGYLYAITRDAELAEEVYQNAAIVVLEKTDEAAEIRNFRAWAKEVIRRQALHAIRARVTTKQHVLTISPQLLESISDAFIEDVSEGVVFVNRTRALKQCLADLPHDKREIVAMRYERDSSFNHISEKIGSSPSAVQRSLSRIRRMLQGCVLRRMKLMEEGV
ncbi:MAG: sigma-70 family RNA polymerase sigma factor [Planctomycetaceae bacterium]